MNMLKSWLIPVIIAGLLFVVVRPIFAQAIEGPLLSLGDITVGSEPVDGYHQVFYISDGSKIFITEGNLNATSPNAVGEYVVYRRNTSAGADGIFLYNLNTATTIQLSSSSNGANPKVNENGNVVWEGWVSDESGGKWQVFLFDGIKVAQLTSGDLSINPNIEGSNIVYGRKGAGGIWRAETYSISQERAVFVTSGQAAKHPKLLNGEIYLGSADDLGEKFALTVEDLYVLGFDDSASSSAELTPAQTPESTQSAQPEDL